VRLTLLLGALVLGACGGTSAPYGRWPGPKGTAAVALWGVPGGYLPAACYDPLWVTLRGPADCADLVPPGVTLRRLDGATAVVDGRGPAPCSAVRLLSPAATPGWALWPPAVQGAVEGEDLRVDLDADGVPERVGRPRCPDGGP
jgi:hypothetical protein